MTERAERRHFGGFGKDLNPEKAIPKRVHNDMSIIKLTRNHCWAIVLLRVRRKRERRKRERRKRVRGREREGREREGREREGREREGREREGRE